MLHVLGAGDEKETKPHAPEVGDSEGAEGVTPSEDRHLRSSVARNRELDGTVATALSARRGWSW
jgi:hypothetical protein